MFSLSKTTYLSVALSGDDLAAWPTIRDILDSSQNDTKYWKTIDARHDVLMLITISKKGMIHTAVTYLRFNKIKKVLKYFI
jgi:hypothetical protein